MPFLTDEDRREYAATRRQLHLFINKLFAGFILILADILLKWAVSKATENERTIALVKQAADITLGGVAVCIIVAGGILVGWRVTTATLAEFKGEHR